MRVLIVDDQPLVRTGLEMILSSQPDIEVAGEAGDGAAAVLAVERLARQGEPVDVVIMDIRMPLMDGVTATKALCDQPDGPKVMVLTTFDTDEDAFAALQAGASGFLLKDTPPAELLAGVQLVAGGDALLSPGITRHLIEAFVQRPTDARSLDVRRLEVLTERERDVLTLVAKGLSNAEIATRLYISPATVKTHVARTLTKLDARDRAQLIVIAYESRLVRPGET